MKRNGQTNDGKTLLSKKNKTQARIDEDRNGRNPTR